LDEEMKALFDHHHAQLSQALIYLFEMRLGIELYRPEGAEWYPDYYYHPLPEEALANLTPGGGVKLRGESPSPFSWLKRDATEIPTYYSQDNTSFRWMRLEECKDLDYIICTSERNEQRFFNLRRNLGLKAKIIRYVGNADEAVNPDLFDIFIPAYLPLYEQYVHTGQKPGLLYHPEFDAAHCYHYTAPPDLALGYVFGNGDIVQPQKSAPNIPIVRNFLNFTYHHREPGSPWETWCRYENYVNELKGKALLHGLGTPPHGIETEMDVIIDTAFDRMGRPELRDRSKWPDLTWNRGEPSSHTQIGQLMRMSNAAVHIKRSPPEGYGFVVHCLAACGRPPIIEYDAYRNNSARAFLQHKETCLYVTGHDPTDRENLRWALEPENNLRMSKTLYDRFMNEVDFAAEAAKLKALL
jgi:hypothetical protein